MSDTWLTLFSSFLFKSPEGYKHPARPCHCHYHFRSRPLSRLQQLLRDGVEVKLTSSLLELHRVVS